MIEVIGTFKPSKNLVRLPNYMPQRDLRPHFYTATTLTEDLEISRRTLSRWVSAGLLPKPKRLGRHRYWDREEVRQALLVKEENGRTS
ncbi:MAG: helix-turn-helix domain-containing protein [Planctomycetota bacterium]|nr:helix-turn-helix domain-containing protein [Planctomycetota bacterium]